MFARQLSPFLFAFLAGIALVFAPASPVHATDRDRVEAFLTTTGFDVALESIALSAENAPRMLGREAGDFGAQWTRLAERVFDTDRMHDMAVGILVETLDQDDLAHAAGFYATDLGQRLVVAENASHREADRTGKLDRGEALFAELEARDSPKVEVFQRMNDAISSDDASVRAVEEIQVRFLMAASAAGVLGQRLDEGALRAALAEDRDELRSELRRNALAGAAFTYRDFSVEDLEAYAEALEHPRMRRVYELLNAVQHEIMAGRFEALAVAMAQLAPQEEL
ncbi:DUF2059 domain-containing protein [Lutimaribacter sp. EGI FJ00015]|uniref:DUF2059 domain-containing protein n=1 Tax=Lutimaribacter degradans TaxID=2945989 RepID=A0ACC5ZVN8_9RHOB|nr:DUF2059 domain-containing protein [Lutimaribacter sp. EGI FJ00013]MCM2562255.1 DUF2059 domain-containing protein [Lutimaribacter sp. EGI FJ00013]MCO0613410.1 DUF2059 domain-containing protein [Lutimaribacter sp. EGI FJ00015]MCO0636384.1 DUF2059 domain-containing protein [Lutimaribacter sp. EGI FJ00014]